MFEMRVALFYGPNFSQFIHRFKYSYDYDSNMRFLSVGLTSKFSTIHKEIWGLLNVSLAELFNFSQFQEKNTVLPNFYQFTEGLGNRYF